MFKITVALNLVQGSILLRKFRVPVLVLRSFVKWVNERRPPYHLKFYSTSSLGVYKNFFVGVNFLLHLPGVDFINSFVLCADLLCLTSNF